MVFTLSGMVTLVSLLSENAFFPISVTPEPMVNSAIWLFLKASSPMPVTPPGMVTAVNSLVEKASLPMVWTPSPIVTICSFPRANALSPMFLTLEGMTIPVNSLFENAYSPMPVTLEGMVTAVRSFRLNALLPIPVTGFPLIYEGMLTSLPPPVYLVMTSPSASSLHTKSLSVIIFSLLVVYCLRG
jgi:hypothetical protein